MSGLRSFFVLLGAGIVTLATFTGAAGFVMPVATAFAQIVAPASAIASTVPAVNPNAAVASTVQAYFSDLPIMIAIAGCESGPRQYAANGSPLYAGTDDEMVGVFQENMMVHYSTALALGFDITTLQGNLGYARYLYGESGTGPWISSFPCWGSEAAAATASTPMPSSTPIITTPASVASPPVFLTAPPPTATTTSAASASAMAAGSTALTASGGSTTALLTLDLSLGVVDPQVLILQHLLNNDGFTLATSGPGSPGNETDMFGLLTYAALKKFQCSEGIACSGDEATTGYGLLNAPTRAALLAYTGSAPAATVAAASVSAPTATVATVPSASTPSSTATLAIATTTPGADATTTSESGQSDDNTLALADTAAETASLQSRITALMTIVQQLEAEIAAR